MAIPFRHRIINGRQHYGPRYLNGCYYQLIHTIHHERSGDMIRISDLLCVRVISSSHRSHSAAEFIFEFLFPQTLWWRMLRGSIPGLGVPKLGACHKQHTCRKSNANQTVIEWFNLRCTQPSSHPFHLRAKSPVTILKRPKRPRLFYPALPSHGAQL